jgi:hypothetical protein
VWQLQCPTCHTSAEPQVWQVWQPVERPAWLHPKQGKEAAWRDHIILISPSSTRICLWARCAGHPSRPAVSVTVSHLRYRRCYPSIICHHLADHPALGRPWEDCRRNALVAKCRKCRRSTAIFPNRRGEGDFSRPPDFRCPISLHGGDFQSWCPENPSACGFAAQRCLRDSSARFLRSALPRAGKSKPAPAAVSESWRGMSP